MERKAIEKFLNEIDEGLVVYAPFLREKGFTSNLSVKFLKDEHLLTLGIQIPLGHKRLLQNAVAKLQNAKSKMGITPEPEDEDDTRQQNDRKGLLRPLKLFDPLKSSIQSNKVSMSNSSSASRPERSEVCAEPCTTSFSGKRTPREQGPQILSPVQRMFQQKREEIIEKKAELEKKKVQKAEFISKIERARSLVIQLEGDGARCSKCHLPKHTVKSCDNVECKSAEHCGLLKRHKEDKDIIDEIDRDLTQLERTIDTLEANLQQRKQSLESIESGINHQIEALLLQEYETDYLHLGMKNWVRLNRDIAYVKKIIGKSGKPNLEVVKKIMDEKCLEDECYELEGSASISCSKPRKRPRTNPVSQTMASYGLLFPRQAPYYHDLVPANEEEESEQLKMVMTLSKHEKEAETVCVSEVSSDTKTSCHKNLSEGEAAQNYLMNFLLCIFSFMSFVFNSRVERINFMACVFNFLIGPINFMLRIFNYMVWRINFMLDIFNFVTHLINFVLCVFSFMTISSHYLINAMLCLSNFKVFVVIFTLCAFNII